MLFPSFGTERIPYFDRAKLKRTLSGWPFYTEEDLN